jgi:putative transposase
MIRGKYKCYSLEVKAAIIESRNPNLFPDLLIPKSTAQHWIRKGPDVNRSVTALTNVSKVEGNLEALTLIIKCLGEEINLSVLTESEVNRLRLALFSEDSFLKTHLGKRLQNRLRSNLSPCKKSLDRKCLKRFSSQLTQMEVATMKKLVTSARYAHMSISSLSLLAPREGLLFCSHHTWYKYIARHKWLRPHTKKKKPVRTRGLKAKKPHEIWHIDISQIATSSGEKFYLQVILDNYSRFVLAWSLRRQISASGTNKLIKRARQAVVIAMEESLIIADGGPENTAMVVTCAIDKLKPRLIRKIARKEIRHSNTMIEIFFKMLKNNHLYHKTLKNRQDIAREISFYVHQHNHIVPMRALGGSTPAEALDQSDLNTPFEIAAKKNSERRAIRMNENRAGICQICL